MKVVLVGPARTGGVARSLARHEQLLRQHGYTVVHVEPTSELFVDDLRMEGERIRLGVAEVQRPEEWAPALAALLERLRPAWVAGYYATTYGWGAVEAAAAVGSRSLLMCRGSDVDGELGADRLATAVSRASAVTAVSREMAMTLAARFGRVATVVPNGVDPARFFPDPAGGRAFRARLCISPATPVLGLFGDLKAKRGVERVARVASDYTVLLIGRVRAEVRAALRPDWIHVPYLRADQALRAAYAACDVVAQPSHHDGAPNVVLEAMACGRLVIGTPVGGLKDLIHSGENGVLCATDAEWRSALEARPELGAHARERVMGSLAREREALAALLADASSSIATVEMGAETARVG